MQIDREKIEPPQAMQSPARRRRGLKAGEMLRIAQRPFVFAWTRHRGASGGGAQSEALTQCADEDRFGVAVPTAFASARNIGVGAQNLVEQCEPCAGEKLRGGHLSPNVAAAGFLRACPRRS